MYHFISLLALACLAITHTHIHTYTPDTKSVAMEGTCAHAQHRIFKISEQ